MAYQIQRFDSPINLSFIRPEKMDLAVPGAPQQVGNIMKHYPLPWVRASNCAYFVVGSGQGLGAIWERGTQYAAQPDSWPTLSVEDGVPLLCEMGTSDYANALFACAGGPMLVLNGAVTDIAAEIAQKGFPDVDDGVKTAQVAVGLRPDNLLVHAVAASLTLTEMAQVMREFGCHIAMCYDGGDSATLYRRSGNQPVREFGSDTALYPCALVIQAEEGAPPDTSPAVAGHGRMIMGQALAEVSQMEDHCHAINPEAPYYAQQFLQIGSQLGIRGDIAYAQALLETNYFRFTGLVHFWQHNFGGLGATGPGQNGEVFASAYEGILAQVEHLYAYATARPLPTGILITDPRFDLVSRASAPTVDLLSGRWAVGPNYGAKIEEILEKILLVPPRTVSASEHSTWFATNTAIAAAAYAERVNQGASPLAPQRKGRAYSGIVTVQQETDVFGQPYSQGYLMTLPAGRIFPSFRKTLPGDWHQVTLQSGQRGWVRSSHLTTLDTPDSPPTDPMRAIVVIDPGHGGAEPGAIGPSGVMEKQVNLAIAIQLKNLLEGAVGRVLMTRTTDVDVSLDYRADLATASGGNLFLSIHNNSFGPSSTGTETYYQCGYEQDQATQERSRKLACVVQGAVLSYLAAHNQNCGNCCPPYDRGVICRLTSQENPRDLYYVLRNSFIPAALVESLFISNPQEEACLASPTVQAALGAALYQGIIDALQGFAGVCTFKGPYFGL